VNAKKGQSTFDIQTLFSEKVVRRMKYIQGSHYGVFFRLVEWGGTAQMFCWWYDVLFFRGRWAQPFFPIKIKKSRL